MKAIQLEKPEKFRQITIEEPPAPEPGENAVPSPPPRPTRPVRAPPRPRAARQQLSTAAHRPCADTRPYRQTLERGPNERIARVFAFGDGRDDETIG